MMIDQLSYHWAHHAFYAVCVISDICYLMISGPHVDE